MSRTRSNASSIEYALLGFLQDGPLHGYELHQRLHSTEALGLVWRIKQAHLYALLGKLEADGLIMAELAPQEARPPRRLLRLTSAGQAAFDRWLRAPVEHGRDVRFEFLARLYWARHAGPEAVRLLIGAQRAACQSWRAALAADVDQASEPYAELVARFRLGQVNAMLHWLDECEAALSDAAIAH